ncbi:MAG: SMP-30/gluconolactonase/LRE family protein [Chloroflexota bacterium]|nr:SMP-30/gluconolactonase/LRE family protein [Chloroflexota bacterium]
MSRRLLAALIAAITLASTQPALARPPAIGVVRTLVDLATADCHNPEGIAVAPDGTLYAAGFSGNICVVTPEGAVTRVIPVAPGPGAVTNFLGDLFEPSQGLYVTDIADFGASAAGRVLLVDPATGDARTLAGGFLAPNAIAQDRHRNLYVSDSFAGAIYKVDPEAGGKKLWIQDARLTTKGMPPFGANGVAFDRNERFLYVSNTGDSVILRIAVNRDGTAGALEVFAKGATAADPQLLHGADGIAFDVKGRLWVCANQANEIQVLSPDGTLVARYSGAGADAMDFPASLVFHERSLYVTNLAFGHFGGKISVLRVPFPGAPLRP